MTVNPPVVKLCVNCRHLIQGNCHHESNMRFSYVDGKMGTHNTADYLRRENKRGDGSLVCGPTGRFHERAPDPNGYETELPLRAARAGL